MDSSNWLLLDPPLEFNLNLSLSDPNSPRFESERTSNDTILSQESKNEEKQSGDLVEELNRMNTENKKLTQMLTSICENYQVLHSQLINYLTQTPKTENGDENPKKRKAGFEVLDYEEIQGNSEQSCISYEDSCKRARLLNCKPKVSKILIRTEKSDTKLGVKDGYHWRKYGQKVTRDNPSPRAYFKCASAPICPVKKKVQRSVEDPYILVATYEGEHNHAKPSSRDIDHVVLGSSHTLNHCSISETLNPNMKPHESIMNPNVSNSKMGDDRKPPSGADEDTKTLQRFLAEKMAASLTSDPSFTTALAAAVSGKMLNGANYERWL